MSKEDNDLDSASHQAGQEREQGLEAMPIDVLEDMLDIINAGLSEEG